MPRPVRALLFLGLAAGAGFASGVVASAALGDRARSAVEALVRAVAAAL